MNHDPFCEHRPETQLLVSPVFCTFCILIAKVREATLEEALQKTDWSKK
jgi:hypothetical protein